MNAWFPRITVHSLAIVLSVLTYVLEASDVLPVTTWNAVPGFVNNSVTLPAGPGNRFFRLRKQ